jgi:hypothetical protein
MAERPSLATSDRETLVLANWEHLTVAQKERWHEAALEDKARYIREMEEYNARKNSGNGGHARQEDKDKGEGYVAKREDGEDGVVKEGEGTEGKKFQKAQSKKRSARGGDEDATRKSKCDSSISPKADEAAKKKSESKREKREESAAESDNGQTDIKNLASAEPTLKACKVDAEVTHPQSEHILSGEQFGSLVMESDQRPIFPEAVPLDPGLADFLSLPQVDLSSVDLATNAVPDIRSLGTDAQDAISGVLNNPGSFDEQLPGNSLRVDSFPSLDSQPQQNPDWQNGPGHLGLLGGSNGEKEEDILVDVIVCSDSN